MRVCRTCLSRNNITPLFGDLNFVRFNRIQLLTATGIQINQNDGMPQTACKSCVQTIKDILQFRQICTKTDEILKSITNSAENGEFKIESSLYQDIISGEDEKICDRLNVYPEYVTDELLNSTNSDHDDTDTEDDKKLISFVKEVKISLPRKTLKDKFKNKTRKKVAKNTDKQNLEDTSGIKLEDLESGGESENVMLDDDDFDLSVPHDDNALWLTKENLADTNKLRSTRIPSLTTQTKTSRKSRKELMARNRELMDLAVSLGGRQVECRLCHAQVERASFLSHAKIHFEHEFACEFCAKKFHSRHHMYYHQQRKHGKQKRLACAKCAFRAVDRPTLIRHERAAHTDERPYVCAECGRAFRMRSNVVQHMRRHFGVKNRQCDRCPAMFKTISELWSHQSKVHFMTYTYPCYLCPTVYKSGCPLKRHLVNVHGVPTHQQQRVKCVKTKKSEDPPPNANHVQDSVFPTYHKL